MPTRQQICYQVIAGALARMHIPAMLETRTPTQFEDLGWETYLVLQNKMLSGALK